MTKRYRTPDGTVYDPEHIDVGKECERCGRFIPVRDDEELPANASDADGDYCYVGLTDFAGRQSPVAVGDWSGEICPDCRDELIAHLSPEVDGTG